jgi:hypothetical protein
VRIEIFDADPGTILQNAKDFTAFLQGYIARWAGRAGVP